MELPTVSIVITSYNRPDLLIGTYSSLLSNMDYPRNKLELILADDGSSEEFFEKIAQLSFDKVSRHNVNRGLGANINSGMKLATGEYIVYLQDDCEITGPPDFLKTAISVLEAFNDIGYLRLFCAFSAPPIYRKRFLNSGNMVIRVFDPGESRNHPVYSDLPHVQSRAFRVAMGEYKESKYMQHSERDMQLRFALQRRFLGASIEGLDCFIHRGESQSWRTQNETPREKFGRIRRHLFAKFSQKKALKSK